MDFKYTKLAYEIAPHCKWDPSDTSEEPEVDINQAKIIHAFKRFFKEQGWEKEFTDISGETLYNTVKRISIMNLLLFMEGSLSKDDLIGAVKEGIQETKMYPFLFPIDGGKSKETLEYVREIQQRIHEMYTTGEYEVGEVKTSDFDLSLPEAEVAKELNDKLSENKLPPLFTMLNELKENNTVVSQLQGAVVKADKEITKLDQQVVDLQERIAEFVVKEQMAPQVDLTIESDGTIPEGKLESKKASEVFPQVYEEFKDMKDFDVPFFVWDGVHPDVPQVDPHYIFRPKELVRVLFALVTNQRGYLHGHTGSGKTTLIEQVCANLNYPFVRVNFDSNITRFDLMGRDVLTADEEGRTVSNFVDGILPRAMSSPCVFCADEIDFCQPDVSYVMQAATEGNALRIPEDGDRIVQPHPSFRMFATGNTVGQGDEHGMYQGARPQSLAFLDRFTVWSEVKYMDKKNREELVKRHYPSLTSDDLNVLSRYTEEHIEAFVSNKVLQPITPRGMLAIAKACVILGDMKEALEMSVFDKASGDDRATFRGLIDRVTK